jgi:hypothetical protein
LEIIRNEEEKNLMGGKNEGRRKRKKCLLFKSSNLWYSVTVSGID